MIKGGIFDVDGTIFDSMGIWWQAGYRYLTNMGVEADSNIGNIYFSMTLNEVAEHMIREFGLDASYEEIKSGIHREVEQFYFDNPKLKPGAKALLEWMKANQVPMVIASSTQRDCIESALDMLGIRKYFKDIFTCMEVGKSKNHVDIFQRALESLGTEKSDTWVFEDGLYSMKTAKAFGLSVVGVYDDISHEDWLEIMDVADISVKSLTELDYSQL